MKASFFDFKTREAFVELHQLKAFRIKQIEQEIFRNSVIDFQEMTALPKDLRNQLDEAFTIIPFEVDGIHE